MKKLKLFFACLLMAVLSIGQVWAEDATTSWDFKTLQSTSGTTSEGVSWETGKTGSANATACNATNGLVLYGVATGGGYFQTTSATSGSITNVNIVSAAKKYSPKYTIYCSENGTDWAEIEGDITPGTKDLAISGSYTYLKIANTTAATAQLAVSSIVLSYESGGSTKTLTGVTVSGAPTKTEYYAGDDFDPAGLTVTGTYSDATTGPITSGITWAYNPAQELELNQTSIGVTATVGSISSSEYTVSSLSVTAAPAIVSTVDGIEDGGTYYIRGVRSSGSIIEYLKFTDGTAGATIAGGSASTIDDAVAITFNKVSDGVYQLVTPAGLYVQPGASNGKIALSTSATTCTLTNTTKTWDSSAAIAISTVDGSSNTWIIQKNSSGTNFGGYKNSQYDVTLVPAPTPAVNKPTISGNENFLTSTTVTLACTTDGATIYYTTDGSDPKSSATTGTSFTLTNSATVRAIAKKGDDWSAEATKTFTKGTKITVATAITLIPNKDDTQDNQFVEGYVCTAGTSVSSGQMTYYISDDGTETNRLQIFKGKNLNNTNFAATTDLSLQDKVVVFGQLKNYNNTPEMNSGNYIVEREAAAVAAPTFTPDGGGFLTTQSVTLACTTDGAEIRYTTDGTEPTELSALYSEPIELSATTTITAAAFKGGASSSAVARLFTKGTKITVADALAALDLNNPIENQFVYGIVSTAPTSNPSSGRLTYYISDDGTTTSQLEVFNGYGLNGAVFADKTDLKVGDEVTVFGNLKIYNETKEFDANNYLLEFNRPTYAVTEVTLESTASVAIGGHVTLHAAVVPATASDKEIVWSVQSGSDKASVADGVVTGIAEGTAVIRAASHEDETIYAECTVTVAPLSSWATTYTSNIELSIEGGTSASVAKVKFDGEETEYAAIKAGVSGTAGAVVVNVPAGATALHFHAYSWYNETVKLTVTAPAGVTVSPATAIAINQNTGINGNSPFTLEAGSTPQYDAYYAVSLTGNTEPIALTITATSGKRFVLFGVNQEGGIVLESISVGGTATVLEYTDGQHFDPTGLTVTGHYTDASTAPITEGIVWAFDPDPLTEGTTSVSVTATAAGFTSDAFVVNGLTVNGAAPLSPWATTWTSNLDDITGSKVKFYGEETEYAALKAGTSGTAGTATLHIPAQATELHLHAYGWNSEDVTLSITAPAGVTVAPASITLNRNSGFASNSPFTLAEGSTPQTDAYYALSLSGNTDAIELTITATEGKRFLLFGVNQVGGVVPVLQNIEIIGDLTNKSGYKAGDELNMEGLTVYAYYTLGGDPYTNEDITDKVEWSYDALVEGQTSVTITATYKGQTDDITINDLEPVASADPKIYVSTLNVNFASVEVGESVPAAETVTVTLTNVASVTATLGGTNADAFSVSPASLTESGDITISILANTDAAASYSATLTISDGEGGADDKTVNLSFEVTEPVVTEEYQLVSDVTSLAAGDQIIIVAENAGTYYTLDGSITSQYFPSTAVSISAGIITAPSTSAIILGKDEDNWTMSMGGQLIGATAAKKASLGNGSASNTWTIAIAENVATITNTTTTFGSLQFNYNNGSNSRFLNYTSAQTAVAIYKKVTPEPPTPTYTTVREGLSAGRYYTICYPKAMTAIKGGTLWSFVGRDADFAYIQQESAPFTAGKPYLIYATAEKLEAVLEGEAAAAGNYNGLYGTLSYMSDADLTGVGADYLLKNNELHPIGTGAYLEAQRAYIIKNDIPEGAPAQAPGKHIRTMPMHKDATTGIDNLNASDAPRKMVIDGTMFILRGEKLYDATGRLVK